MADADLSVDFATQTRPTERVARLATQPLTVGEPWQRLAPGELVVLQGGQRLS